MPTATNLAAVAVAPVNEPAHSMLQATVHARPSIDVQIVGWRGAMYPSLPTRMNRPPIQATCPIEEPTAMALRTVVAGPAVGGGPTVPVARGDAEASAEVAPADAVGEPDA